MTLSCTYPSGAKEVVDIRMQIANACLRPPWWANARGKCGVLIHRSNFDSVDTKYCYIGSGAGKATPPSPWCNPYSELGLPPGTALQKYEYYANARADLAQWLHPLIGKHLLCNCAAGSFCHGSVLQSLVDVVFCGAEDDDCAACSGMDVDAVADVGVLADRVSTEYFCEDEIADDGSLASVCEFPGATSCANVIDLTCVPDSFEVNDEASCSNDSDSSSEHDQFDNCEYCYSEHVRA